MLEVLLSIMNVNNEKEYKEILKSNNINGNVVAVNQTQKLDAPNIWEGKQRIYSYNEKGASRSRNRLLEHSKSDICIFADDDMTYIDNYEKIIENEYKKHEDAEMIIFNITNKNKNREKIKKHKDKRISFFDIMRARTPEITLKNDIIKKYNLKFNENFGPNAKFLKGEETVFLAECYKKNIKIYLSSENIGYVYSQQSSWFKGFNEKFLYDQGAIFYKISHKRYKLLIYQYLIRKYFLYRKNTNIIKAYKSMISGANECKKIGE